MVERRSEAVEAIADVESPLSFGLFPEHCDTDPFAGLCVYVNINRIGVCGDPGIHVSLKRFHLLHRVVELGLEAHLLPKPTNGRVSVTGQSRVNIHVNWERTLRSA